MKVWKVLGLAGLAGVAATGAVIARDQRRRSQLTPDQVREQLHRRLEEMPTGCPNPRSSPTRLGVLS